MLRGVRVAHFHFYNGFRVDDISLRFPCIGRKYRLVADQDRPDLVVAGPVPDGRYWHRAMQTPPDLGVPTLFLTGENVAPDMSRCDFAISFRRDIDTPRHMRIPNWVQRLNRVGMSPRNLLAAERRHQDIRQKFCAFVYRNQVPFREKFARVLSLRAPVDAAGRSMNNMPGIGPEISDKLAFLREYRFTIAFENARSPGYTTEKLPEAMLAGTVPIYWGDPLVGMDFNRDAFLDLADFASAEELADAVLALNSDERAWQRRRDQPAYVGDRLPECADDDRMFAFWETVLDAALSNSKARAPSGDDAGA